MALGLFLPAKYPQLSKSLIGKFSRFLSRHPGHPSQTWAQEALLNPCCGSKVACPEVLLLLVWLEAFGSRRSHFSFSFNQQWVGAHLQLFQARQGHGLTSPASEVASVQGFPSKSPSPPRAEYRWLAVSWGIPGLGPPAFVLGFFHISSSPAGTGPDAEKGSAVSLLLMLLSNTHPSGSESS